jgi:hypothetical protein
MLLATRPANAARPVSHPDAAGHPPVPTPAEMSNKGHFSSKGTPSAGSLLFLMRRFSLTPTPAPLDATQVYIGTELRDAASYSPWAHLSLLQQVR